MAMTRAEFKDRWEGDDRGGGITHDDVADCAQAWGLYSTPRIHPVPEVLYAVLVAAGTNDAEKFKPDEE